MNLPLWPLVVPLLTLIATFATNRLPSVQRLFAALGALGSLAVAGLLLREVSSRGPVHVAVGGWEAPFGIILYVDHASAGFVLFAAIVHAATTARQVFRRESSRLYWPLLNGLVLGVQGAFVTADIFNLYVWFEVLLLSSFVLVALGNAREQSGAALRYAVLNFFSSASFLLGIALLYGSTGTLNFAELSLIVRAGTTTHLDSVAAFFLVGFAIKAALFPFSMWLPFAYSTPPASAAIPMAALLTKVGVYALLRTGVLVFGTVWWFDEVLSIAAIVSIVIGAVGMFAEVRLRAIAAHTIVFASGFMLLGVARLEAGALAGVLTYAFADMLVVWTLFVFIAEMEGRSGAIRLDQMGGYYRHAPWSAAVLGLLLLSVAGFPPMVGFWAKLLLLQSVAEASWLLVGLALSASALVLLAVCRAWSRAAWRDGEQAPAAPDSRLGFAVGSLVAVAFVALSVYPEPLVELARAGARDMLDIALYQEILER